MCSQRVSAIALSSSVIVFCAVGAACSSQAQQAPVSPSRPLWSAAAPPPSAPSAADVGGERAMAAYVGMWQAMAHAGAASQWQSPEVARYATGNALTTITRSLYTDHFNHLVTRGVPKNSPQVTSVVPQNVPETVMLSDCGDSTGTSKVQEATNRPVPDTPGGRRSIVAEVKQQADGLWRVTQFAVEGVGTC